MFLYPVLLEVISLAEPSVLVNLSLCSKKIQSLIRSYFSEKSAKWELMMVAGLRPSAIIHYKGTLTYLDVLGAQSLSELKQAPTEFVNIGGIQIPALQRQRCLDTFWEDGVQGLKAIMDYTSDLFNLPVGILSLRKGSLWMIDWVNNSRQSAKPNTVTFESHGIETCSNADMEFILRNIRAIEVLSIYISAEADFRFYGNFPIVRQIHFRHGHWLTVGDLMNMDSHEIIVWKTKLSSMDINTFLLNWMTGGSRRLEYFNIEVEQLDVSKIFGNGLGESVAGTEEVRLYYPRPYGTECLFEGGYSIQRKDGVKATIKFGPNWLCMAVWDLESDD